VVVTLPIKDKDDQWWSTYNKYFNKWFLVNHNKEDEKPVWNKSASTNKIKHCLAVGMVTFDPSI
jgi:RecA-family ATPase